jgi:hypothetical protein
MTLSNVEVTEHDNNHIFYDESSVVDLVTITKINPDHAFKKYFGPATEFLPQFISNYNLKPVYSTLYCVPSSYNVSFG